MKAISFLLVLIVGSTIKAHDDIDRCIKIAQSYCSGIRSVTTEPLAFHLVNHKRVQCSDYDQYDLTDRNDYLKQLNNVDLSDILKQDYPFSSQFTGPLGNTITPGHVDIPIRDFNNSPGRFRNDDILMATYGGSESEVLNNLVTVHFLGKKIKFNKQNGAASALARVSKELSKRGLHKYFWNFRTFSGSVKFRKISGTNRISSHSYGISIDLLIKHPRDRGKSQYWKWSPRCRTDIENHECHELGGKGISKLPEYRLDVVIPWRIDDFSIEGESRELEVVSIFEENGFIWGGKWFHYDTMHFEYRPEFYGGHTECPSIVSQIQI